MRHLNGVPAHLVFLYFLGANDVGGPTSPDGWHGATERCHAALGLPTRLPFVTEVFAGVSDLRREA